MKFFKFIIVILFFASCNGGDSLIQRTYNVKYIVSGTSPSIKIFYQDKDGITQMTTVYNPDGKTQWSIQYRCHYHTFLQLKAVNLDTTGNVRAKIMISNKEIEQNENDTIVMISTFVE